MAEQAWLILEDGRRFAGTAFGFRGVRTGEVVFNTSLTGYQEVLTDPSYAEQIVVMTVPHVGNYGVTAQDEESVGPQVHGFAVREVSRRVSNYRATGSLGDYLAEHGVPGIEGLDTRSLTRHIRTAGAMRGIVGNDGTSPEELLERLADYDGLSGLDLAGRVTCSEPYVVDPSQQAQYHVVVLDFGMKRQIARLLADRGPARVTVVPAHTAAADILALRPDGVMLSNGPGDPEPVAAYAGAQVRELLGKVPIMGICMGFQVLGLALGGSTYKLKFGHRGGNQPVRDEKLGKVEITAQNHGFAVDADSLPRSEVDLTHHNLNDGTLAGFSCRGVPAFGVQFHPEANPGPHDSRHLFDDFFGLIDRTRRPR
jgi:carbamoyl-phosphate synthase small subunit